MIKYTLEIFSEIALIVLYPLSTLILKVLPRSEFKPHGTGQPLVIVERWVNYNIRHIYWKHYLQRQGFRVYIKNFPIYKGSFDKSSAELDDFLSSNGIKNAILVGISAGAITSLIYLQEKNGWSRVSKFVTVGAPFEGTWSAIFLLFARSGWEILPNSSLIKRIRNYRIKNSDKILCIASKFDEMVPFGSYLKGTKKYTIDIIGHNNLHLRIKSTYKKIVEFASE